MSIMSMREELLNSLTPYLNLTKFEVSNNYELSKMIEDYKTNKIFEGGLKLHRKKGKRLQKRYIPSPREEQTVDPAVLYMNLGNKNNAAQYDCPTASDSSAVSLAQMAFLSMTVSIFTVIATIANNINNNNNNNNNNNLNLVKQKTQSISQNQNVVNQINIDLPPPVPGRKKRSIDSLESKLRRRQEFATDFFRSGHLNRSKRTNHCDSTYLGVTKALANIAKASMDVNFSIEDKNIDIVTQRQCFGREICLRLVENRIVTKSSREGRSAIEEAVHEFETLYLLYTQLSDNSLQFTKFLDDIKHGEEPQTPLACLDIFPECS